MSKLKKLKESLLNANSIANYKRMWPYVYPFRFRALIALLLTIPVGAMDAIIAMFLRPFMDTVMIEQNLEKATYIPFLIIGFSFLQSACNYGSAYFNAWVGGNISRKMKKELFAKLVYNEQAFFDKANSGEVLVRYSSDADTACGGLLATVRLFVTKIFSSLALIGVLIWNSWELSIIAVTCMLVAMFPLTTVRKKIKGIVKASVESSSEMMTSYNEAFSGSKIVASYNLQEYQENRFKTNIDYIFRLGMKMTQRTAIMSPLMHFIVSIGIAGVIWLGSYLIVNQFLSPGEFVSFVAALLMLYTPLKSIGNSYTGVQTAILAMERVFEVIDRENEIKEKEDAQDLVSIQNKIEYKDVVFSYVDDVPVLKKLSLEIPIGKNVAFVGNSGGGKTSLVNLLPRFYDIQSGSISIDGVDIKDLKMNSLRSHISVVFQDNFLFAGTIRENILIGNQNATEDELNLAIENACLSEFIASLEDGVDTEIGERGVLLSGGQKQRIGIARAFIKNAPIVILDEATSALDNKSEAVVQKAINNLMKDRTVLIIAHRLSTVRHVDTIFVVNHGEIVEQGSHDELIAKEDSQYASLYNSSLY